jgi:AcrR family transcriptional regulator
MPIEVRREQVLDAALRLISEHGYSAASMEASARGRVGEAARVRRLP